MTREEIENNLEYYQKMSKGLGHHSWWYTNRGSEDCINVKVHAYNKNNLKDLLTPKELKLVWELSIDIEDYQNDLHNESIQDACDVLEQDLKLECSGVDSIEYGGRSGGWLAIVYSFNNLYELEDMLQVDTISKKDLKRATKIIKDNDKTITVATNYVVEQHANLIKYLEGKDFINYVHERLQEVIGYKVKKLADKTKNIINILNN